MTGVSSRHRGSQLRGEFRGYPASTGAASADSGAERTKPMAARSVSTVQEPLTHCPDATCKHEVRGHARVHRDHHWPGWLPFPQELVAGPAAWKSRSSRLSALIPTHQLQTPRLCLGHRSCIAPCRVCLTCVHQGQAGCPQVCQPENSQGLWELLAQVAFSSGFL